MMMMIMMIMMHDDDDDDDNKNSIVRRCGRMVKVVDCESTGRGFESTLAPLVNSLRALNQFSLKSTYSGSPTV